MVKTFVWGDMVASDYGIILTAAPDEEIARRDMETVSIQGRSGDLLIDNYRYHSIRITYDCLLLPPAGETFREAVIRFVGNLHRNAGYADLADSFRPEHYRTAALLDAISVESLVERGGVFSLTFTAHPQRWRLDGIYPVPISVTPNSIANPTAQVAKPLITVYGDGAGVLTVNGTAVTIHALSGELTLDCDTLNAYRQPGEGGYINCNGDIYAPEFPVLAPGDNAISWSGGITGIEIIPRWWDL